MAGIAKPQPRMLINDTFPLDIFDYDEGDKEESPDPSPRSDSSQENSILSEGQNSPETIEV